MTPKTEALLDMIRPVQESAETPDPVRNWLGNLMTAIEDLEIPDERFVKGSPMPESIGALADEYSIVRAERLRLQKESEEVKSRETEIHNVILSFLNESADTGASGKLYRVQRVEKEVVNVVDWPALWKYIAENDAFDMLQKRLSDKAVTDRFEEALPGSEEKVNAMVSEYIAKNPEADPDAVKRSAVEHLGLPGIMGVKVPTLSFTKV